MKRIKHWLKKRSNKVAVILLLAFIADFIIYKFCGVGLVNGNLLTIDVDLMFSFKPA